MNHRVRLLHLQRMFLSLTPCYSTCRISVSVCRYLSDEAIPKGLSGETSPACSQGQRSNQLGPPKGNASVPFSALVQGPFRWAHCFRWAHPFLGTSSAPPSSELNPISLEQGTQQFGGVCVPLLPEGPWPGEFSICSCSVRPVQLLVPMFLACLKKAKFAM